MKKGLTELVFILDRSGSMSGLESDTIGDFNGMLDKQKDQEGEANVTTALLDAVGKTIYKLGSIQKYLPDEMRAEKVIFVIITDGLENASRMYDYGQIRRMIERQKERYGWEFLSLGVNMDAVSEAGSSALRQAGPSATGMTA